MVPVYPVYLLAGLSRSRVTVFWLPYCATLLAATAIGAGFALACACDLRIAHPASKLGVTFVGLGLSPGMGSSHWLPTLAGPQVGAEMLLTGQVISGEEAVCRASATWRIWMISAI